MKKTDLLLLPCFSLLAAISLYGQNAPVLNNENNEDQKISPLMMFGEAEKVFEVKTDSRQDQRVTTTPTTAFSQAARGTSGGGGIAEATAPLPEEEDPNAYLENEICENIYTACLARVADMTLGKISLPGGNSVEASARAEWEAAKEMAAEEEEEFKNGWERAKRETLAAQQKLDSANARLHGQAYADEAYYNFQVKELSEQLAEARVRTARTTLNAIKFKDTVQRSKVELKLNEAIELEHRAANALKEATANTVTPRAAQPSIASPLIAKHVVAFPEATEITSPTTSAKLAAAVYSEESLLDQHSFPPTAPAIISATTGEASPLPQPPTPVEDKKVTAARKEIENAEAALEEAEAAHDAAKRAKKAKAGKITIEKEQEAYAAAEEAWTETGLAYEKAITKAKKASLPATEINDLTNTLKEAEANTASWNAHQLQAEARKLEEQTPAVSSVEGNQAVGLEAAWNKAAEAYQEAITKAQTANMEDEAEELTNAFNNAQSKKASWTKHLSEFKISASRAKEEVLLAREQEDLEKQKKQQAEDEAKLAAQKKQLEEERAVLAREQALAKQQLDLEIQERIKKETEAILAREKAVLEVEAKVKADAEAAIAVQKKILEQEQRLAWELETFETAAASANAHLITAAQEDEHVVEQAKQEFEKALEIAGLASDEARAMTDRGRAAANVAEAAKTEKAYNEVIHLTQNIKAAWERVIETKKIALTKAALIKEEAYCTKLSRDIELAEKRKIQCDELSEKSARAAQQAAKQTEHQAQIEELKRLSSESKARADESSCMLKSVGP